MTFRPRLLAWLLPLPLAIPTYIAAYVYVDLFEPLGLVHQALSGLMPAGQAANLLPGLRSLPGAVFVMGLVLYPYVYLSARTMFQMQSAEIAEAARTLGASRWVTFWRVSLPMARPALVVGLALALLETLNDIGASEYLGVNTFTASIFSIWQPRQPAGRRRWPASRWPWSRRWWRWSIMAAAAAPSRYRPRTRSLHRARHSPARRGWPPPPHAGCRLRSASSCRFAFSPIRACGAACIPRSPASPAA